MKKLHVYLLVIFLVIILLLCGWAFFANKQKIDDAKLSKSNKQNSAESQFNLGLMYRLGQGVPKNDAKAAKWYRKAAAQGYAGACVNLGMIYYNGQSVPVDYTKAAMWYRKGAELNDAEGQYNLGTMCYNGLGVSKNLIQAYAWFDLASTQDPEKYSGLMSIAKSKLTPAQLSEAKKLSAELTKKIKKNKLQ